VRSAEPCELRLVSLSLGIVRAAAEVLRQVTSLGLARRLHRVREPWRRRYGVQVVPQRRSRIEPTAWSGWTLSPGWLRSARIPAMGNYCETSASRLAPQRHHGDRQSARLFSQWPLTHSFAQAGASPDLPVLRLSNRRGYWSSRPRKRARDKAIFSSGDRWWTRPRSRPTESGSRATMSSSPHNDQLDESSAS
jgi:hypothetical protein